jgi:DNA-binding transcriptional MerR regulator
METLTVQQAAEFTGLSSHTLRYYERTGLLEPIGRNISGHRRYSTGDLEKLQFLHCLRATGMPIRRMREYAALQGREDLDTKIALLEAHQRYVLADLADTRRKLKIIQAKIERLRNARSERG